LGWQTRLLEALFDGLTDRTKHKLPSMGGDHISSGLVCLLRINTVTQAEFGSRPGGRRGDQAVSSASLKTGILFTARVKSF